MRHHLAHLDRIQHSRRAARVVGIGVADEQRIERCDAMRLQKRHDNPLARMRRFRSGPGIE